MQARELSVEGAYAFTPPVYTDHRGLFVSPFQEAAFEAAVGKPFRLAQTHLNRSARGVVRGVHYVATPPGQAKYVYCVRGRALDVVVDLRVGSPTFGAWDTVEMDDASFHGLYFPLGVGHAFAALDDDTVMAYIVDASYVPDLERTVHPLDPDLDLPWPGGETVLSERDRNAPSFTDARARGLLPRYEDCPA